jgi:hypothetical protein
MQWDKRTNITMTKGKGTREHIIQWPKTKGEEYKKYNDQRQMDKRTNNTMTKGKGKRGHNTMPKGKGTIGQIIPKAKGQEDK